MMSDQGRRPEGLPRSARACFVIALLVLSGCASGPPTQEESGPDPRLTEATERVAELEDDLEQERRDRAQAEQHVTTLQTELAREQERVQQLQREQERLRADLVDAEATLVSVESGLEVHHSRADAVSLFADTRIIVERAARTAPWREPALDEARDKLASAEVQVEAGHIGAAVFFTTRARRIADNVLAETAAFSEADEVLSVRGSRVNLRGGPATRHEILRVLESGTPLLPRGTSGEWLQVLTPEGDVGWIHGNLVGPAP